jgi:hypothetical protein
MISKNILFTLLFFSCGQFFYTCPTLTPQLRDILESPQAHTHLAQVLHSNSNPDQITDSFLNFSHTELSAQEHAALNNFIKQVLSSQKFLLEENHPDAYSDLLKSLEKYKAPLGTTLAQWAQLYLTIDAFITALSALENNPNNQLSSIAEIIVENFILNLYALQKTHQFIIPESLVPVLQEKMLTNLQKFFSKK